VHSEQEIRAAVARAKCRTLELRKVSTEFGEVWYGKHACPDNPSTFRLLLEMAKMDEGDPLARSIALALYNAEPRSPERRARLAHQWVKSHVWFVREPKETFQSPTYTVRAGAGDCDDHAILLNAIAKNADLSSRIVPLRKPNGDVRHAFVEIRIGEVWVPAETTVDAAFGERPEDAARRLKPGREDLM